ncbi:MAG: hypothetical protein CMP20_04460 [Rickettsiales bacterium]|nr:hypothetical protein [Rickettsiales bacterium]
MEDLPIEILQLVGFFYLDDPCDLLSFALASKTMYQSLLADNEYDRDQHRAMAGVWYCLNSKWERAACMAVQRGFGSITEKRYFKMYLYDSCPFCFACTSGLPRVLEALLKRPEVDPTHDEQWGFGMACYSTNIECVKLLLEDGRVDPTAEDNYFLSEAMQDKNQPIIDLLLTIPEIRQVYDNMVEHAS